MLRIHVVGTPAHTEVHLTGTLDTTGSAALLAKLDHLVVDVSGVAFCDSSGVSALVRSRARAVEMAGSLRLVAPSPALRRVLDVTGLTRMFEH
ncbi:STAS domain-containing protein [Lentzea sp. NPDC060358]|uniref:STAS domain-containing protein n=1 Tax=Lentzea sp. NPDC060358 TaxID=3347103 RepID=UPI00365E90FA